MIGGVIFGALVALPFGLLFERLLDRWDAPEPALSKHAESRDPTDARRRA